MNRTPNDDSNRPLVDDLSKQIVAFTMRIRASHAELVLSGLKRAAVVVLDAHDQPPAERNLRLVRVGYDVLVELRTRVAKEPWLSASDILAEPLTTIQELIDMAREMLGDDDPQASSENPQM